MEIPTFKQKINYFKGERIVIEAKSKEKSNKAVGKIPDFNSLNFKRENNKLNFNYYNSNSYIKNSIYSLKNSKKIIINNSKDARKVETPKKKKQREAFISLLNNPKNPYSTTWSNNFLHKKYNCKLEFKKFSNGYPTFKIVKLNKVELSKSKLVSV